MQMLLFAHACNLVGSNNLLVDQAAKTSYKALCCILIAKEH